jgi:hypothetical protein
MTPILSKKTGIFNWCLQNIARKHKILHNPHVFCLIGHFADVCRTKSLRTRYPFINKPLSTRYYINAATKRN